MFFRWFFWLFSNFFLYELHMRNYKVMESYAGNDRPIVQILIYIKICKTLVLSNRTTTPNRFYDVGSKLEVLSQPAAFYNDFTSRPE